MAVLRSRGRTAARGAASRGVPTAALTAALGALAALGGCASLPPLPSRPEPIPYADTLPIREPASRQPGFIRRVVEEAVGDEAGEAIDVRRWAGAKLEALDLTHDDDVVGSAWFEHRNGRRPMSVEAVGTGAAAAPPPDVERPLTVVAGKAEGIMPGLTIRDARGGRYLFKFDPAGSPRLATSADVIASRLLHAAGYHVPADYIVVFDSARLVLDPEARVEVEGRERSMTEDDIRRVLERTRPLEDGRWLAVASRFLPGTPKGPFLFEGRRDDDPNDHYLHEFRRPLRGLYVVSAWLNHVDIRYENTLDTFIDPPGYLRHHLIDFASSLGSGGVRPHHPQEGREHNFDFWPTFARIFTLGFYRLGWEGEEAEEIHPAVGWLPVEGFRPGKWKPNWPNAAFRGMTAADGYWGAKLVGSFTDEQIRGAVEAGALPPEAADTLARILALRRDSTVSHWYGRVTPVEEPRALAAAGGGLAIEFEDAGLARGLWPAGAVRYRWELRDVSGAVLRKGAAPAAPGGRQRLRVGRALGGGAEGSDGPGARGDGALLELRIRALRAGGPDGREAVIWLRAAPSGGHRVVGHRH